MIAAGAVRGVVGGMIDDYARETGHKFNFTVGPTGMLRDTIASGKPADLIITSAPLMRELEATGKITPGSRVDIGRVGLGFVVKAGAPVPDLSTPDAVKQALLKATSIAYSDPKLGATSVTHLMKIAEQFGIKDEVLRKGVLVHRRQRRRREGRERRGRTRYRADQRHPRQGCPPRRTPARRDPALDGLCGGDPFEQQGAGPRPRLHRHIDRARDAGPLAEGRLATS